jgi:hypothetical protein
MKGKQNKFRIAARPYCIRDTLLLVFKNVPHSGLIKTMFVCSIATMLFDHSMLCACYVVSKSNGQSGEIASGVLANDDIFA